MLGKDHMARLRSVVKRHKLAAGSQTVPNSVAEAAIARAELPPVGSSSPIAPPAPSRKNPIMVSDEEDDESTEDGLIRKRNRATVAELPANESTGPDYAENPPASLHPLRVLGMLYRQTPQLLGAFRSKLRTFGGLPNL